MSPEPTLVELGHVDHAEGVFRLRARVLELGFAYLSGLTLPEVARPHMDRLASSLHESCSVSVLDGDDLVYVRRVHARRIMKAAIAVGSRFPAYPTSMGRVLLAHTDPAWLGGYLDRVELRALTPPDRHRPRGAAGAARRRPAVRPRGRGP